MRPIEPSIACRTPMLSEVFRVKPGIERDLSTPTVRHPDTGALFIVIGQAWPSDGRRLNWICPRACVNHNGQLFLWPIPMPNPGSESDSWSESGRHIANLAEGRWTRVSVDKMSQQYRVGQMDDVGDLREPDWSVVDFLSILQAAFRGQIIRRRDHPLLLGGDT